MKVLSIELWVVVQMFIDFVLVVLILYLLRNLKSGVRQDVSKETYEYVVSLIEPLLKESKAAAELFETQLKEKNSLINDLNAKLDKRIVSLNLLLNRSETTIPTNNKNNTSATVNVYDQQEAIWNMYEQGEKIVTIAKKLSMPKGEVELVVDLKKKFMEIG